MASNLNYTTNFYKSLNALTGIPIKKLQEYARDNNPFNILEHPMVIEPNEKQMEKLNKLNEFIANYSLMRMEEDQKRIHFTTPKEAGRYGIDGINFKDGEPDFSEISKGTVEIEPFSDSRTDNFDKADIELAKKKGCSPEEVAKWREENGYTWHECKDMKTMQKVPSEVHNNISHSGGISKVKKGNGELA